MSGKYSNFMSDDVTATYFNRLTRTDHLGMSVSIVCVIHCAAFPLFLVILPFWPAIEVLHGWVHLAFAALILPISVVAIQNGFKLHATPWIAICIGAGVVFIFLALLAGQFWLGLLGEMVLTFIGSVLLIFGHVQNSKMGRKCAPCESSCKVC